MLPNPNSKVIALLTYASKLQTFFIHLQAFNGYVQYLKAHLGLTIATLKLKVATYCLVKTSTLSTSESKRPRNNVLDYKI
jgi:hypothetical protein